MSVWAPDVTTRWGCGTTRWASAKPEASADVGRRILGGLSRASVAKMNIMSVYSDFHSIWRSDAKPWKDSGAYWFCSRCWQGAALAHDKPECHTCSDWGSCGRDCTLSEESCQACSTALPV